MSWTFWSSWVIFVLVVLSNSGRVKTTPVMPTPSVLPASWVFGQWIHVELQFYTSPCFRYLIITTLQTLSLHPAWIPNLDAKKVCILTLHKEKVTISEIRKQLDVLGPL